MKMLLRFALLAAFLAFPIGRATETGIDRIFKEFQDPPRTYSVRPFWFWNGKLDAREVEWQIEQMVSQGVYGAYVHNRNGLETPYLSQEYFQVVRAGFEKARKLGFLFGFVDEYEWPSGEARDIWQRGLPSRVLAANPEFRMRSLGYLEKDVEGPARVEWTTVENFQCALAARLLNNTTIDPESMVDISSSRIDKGFRWDAPAGRWRVMAFFLHPTQGRDGGLVDLLNPDATRKFIELGYEQYYRQLGGHFGSTIDSSYVDHEGDYGYRIAWTPALFETFRQLKGYELRKQLPLLMYEGGRLTPKVRCDYMDVISELYSRSFFKQVTDWCEAHQIKVTGHVWEETLQMEAAFEGDLQRIMRAWAWPGVDSLWDKGRLPRDFKATGSVAHFRGTRFTCENQGLQGADSFLDFQKMRSGTNMIAAWGVNSLIPHAFNYNRHRIEYPPDWFYHQPYWRYFKHYADYARRLSYMNDGGRHVADILVFQPTESAWAHSEPVFSNKSGYIPSKFNNPLDTINGYYTDIMNRLAQERWDYDVADSQYLLESKLKDRRIAIGNEDFGVLLLPPVTTVRRAALARLREFYDRGGMLISIRILPTDSMEEGRDDPFVAETVRHIFGQGSPDASRANANRAGGRAFFVKENVEDVLKLLAANLNQDVKILDGPRNSLFYLHRRNESADFYWLVNDSAESRDNTVLLSANGIAEKWDATDASRSPVFFSRVEGGTETRLHFDPWEAYYVVLTRSEHAPTARLLDTNLQHPLLRPPDKEALRVHGTFPLTGAQTIFAELQGPDGRKFRGSMEAPPALSPIDLKDQWQFRVESAGSDREKKDSDSASRSAGQFDVPVVRYRAPYAETKEDPQGSGIQRGWLKTESQPQDWTRAWLSRERLTVRDWRIIGPFPNEDHRGFWEVYPPERAVDFQASYSYGGEAARWKMWRTELPRVDLEQALGIPRGRNWVTAYAVTYIYAPSARKAQFRIVADNNARLWVNGQNLLDLHIHPFYYEMREDFALIRSADLKPGWNEVLVKISKCAGARWWSFMLRVTDEMGRNFDDLAFSPGRNPDPLTRTQATTAPPAQRWHRLHVPPGTIAVRLPSFRKEVKVFFNGTRIKPDDTGRLYRLPGNGERKDNILMLVADSQEVIGDTPEFLLGGRISMGPGSWTTSGLPYLSGSASYEREFELPSAYIGKKLVLDCGQVGAVAEAWVNDQPAGARVWLPFAFDISKLARAGKNKVKILVTNTMENERAVENHAAKLQRIEPNGLVGPVRIVPYLEVDLRCPRVRE